MKNNSEPSDMGDLRFPNEKRKLILNKINLRKKLWIKDSSENLSKKVARSTPVQLYTFFPQNLLIPKGSESSDMGDLRFPNEKNSRIYINSVKKIEDKR